MASGGMSQKVSGAPFMTALCHEWGGKGVGVPPASIGGNPFMHKSAYEWDSRPTAL